MKDIFITVVRRPWIEDAIFTALRYGLRATCDGNSGLDTLVTARLYLWTGNNGAGLTLDSYRKPVKPDGGWSRKQRSIFGVPNERWIESYYLNPECLIEMVLAPLRRPANIVHGAMLVKISKPPSPQLPMPLDRVS